MTDTNTEKPLQPLSHGNILLVGVKSSNFDDEIKNHPRVIMWDSQDEKWAGKAIPINTQAIFVTRFIGHALFADILKEARAKRITMFNVQGTGVIARQVKELLNMNNNNNNNNNNSHETNVNEVKLSAENQVIEGEIPYRLKLVPLSKFIDYNQNNSENARILEKKAKELNIRTTYGSLIQYVRAQRKKNGMPLTPDHRGRGDFRKIRPKKSDDVTVQMFDSIIKEMTDMREFFVKTIEENVKLKAKVNKFRRFFED